MSDNPAAWMYTGIKSDGSEHGPHLVWNPTQMDAMSAYKGAKAVPLYTCPPCTGNCNQGRTRPADSSPVYAETLLWHHAPTEKPPVDHDVLVTFEDVRGAYIAAWMGSETGWVGVDALPIEKIAWWAALPPGPPLALTAEARRAAAPAA